MSSLSKPWESLLRSLRCFGRTWLAVELGAATLAAAVLIAGLPLVLVILSYDERDVWALIATVGSVSVPAAILLAKSALRVSQDLLSGRS